MKSLFYFLIDHLREDFKLAVYLLTAIFLGLAVYLNYHYNEEIKAFSSGLNHLEGFLMNFGQTIIFYYLVAMAVFYTGKKLHVFKNPVFWLKSLFFLGLIAAERGSYFQYLIFNSFENYNEGLFFFRLSSNLTGVLFYLLPLGIIVWIFDRKSAGIYGLRLENARIRLFIPLILIVLPLVGWASFQDDFLRMYPIFKPWEAEPIFGLTSKINWVIQEAAYCIDFVMVELIFRGALVIGMASLLGKDAILPMVSVYVFIHFGKPMAEAVSSAFGGYILGVFALRLKNILGGSFIHVMLALLMETGAILQYYLK